MIALVVLVASFASASSGEAGGVLGFLGNALQRLSAESLGTARAAAVPVLQGANQTALDARSVLQDLGAEVALAVVRARASGWDAAHCAQDKQKQAQQLLREAQARLDGCTALAAAEAEAPVVTIDNLTQEAVQRIDRAAGDVEACMAGTGAMRCVFHVVRNVTQDVGATTRVIGEQALGAEKSVAHIERYVTTCATAQVQSARTFLQQLNIAACAQ